MQLKFNQVPFWIRYIHSSVCSVHGTVYSLGFSLSTKHSHLGYRVSAPSWPCSRISNVNVPVLKKVSFWDGFTARISVYNTEPVFKLVRVKKNKIKTSYSKIHLKSSLTDSDTKLGTETGSDVETITKRGKEQKKKTTFKILHICSS